MEFEFDSSGLDKIKLNRLKLKILLLERGNTKTREYTRDAMVNKIRRIIEEEVGKCY